MKKILKLRKKSKNIWPCVFDLLDGNGNTNKSARNAFSGGGRELQEKEWEGGFETLEKGHQNSKSFQASNSSVKSMELEVEPAWHWGFSSSGGVVDCSSGDSADRGRVGVRSSCGKYSLPSSPPRSTATPTPHSHPSLHFLSTQTVVRPWYPPPFRAVWILPSLFGLFTFLFSLLSSLFSLSLLSFLFLFHTKNQKQPQTVSSINYPGYIRMTSLKHI